MSLGIITNTSSLAAQRSLAGADKQLEVAMERLSTGKRINSASDDAAGIAIAQRLEAQVRGLDMAGKNATDAQALVSTAESTFDEVHDMLQRLRELAVQSASDTNSAKDRLNLNKEAAQITAELTRMSSSARFNGDLILDGNLSKAFQVGMNASETISLSLDSIAASSLGQHTIDVGPIDTTSLDVDTDTIANNGRSGGTMVIVGNNASTNVTIAAASTAKAAASAINALTGTHGVTATAITEATGTVNTTGAIAMTVNGTAIATVTVGQNAYGALVNAINDISATTGVTAEDNGSSFKLIDVDGDDISLVRTDSTDLDFSLDNLDSSGTANGNAITLQEDSGNDNAMLTGRVKFTSDTAFAVDDPEDTTADLSFTGQQASKSSAVSGLDSLSLSTKAGATSAIGSIDGALSQVASMRSTLGSVFNRLGHTIDNLMATSNATEEALGKLTDADYSVESANMAKAQVLMQASTAMLAQANASPQIVLQLIQ